MRFNYFGLLDIIPAVIWLVILIIVANNYRSKHEDQEHYKYFMPNLYAKLFFALVFSFFYVVVFKGGDTVAYFETSRVMNKLLLHSPGEWFMQMNTDPTWVSTERSLDTVSVIHQDGSTENLKHSL